jgi:polyisoprenoid-binding protein YceI
MNKFAIVAASFAAFSGAWATPVTYTIDPNHTYPSFEADHMGGLSTWRGKLTQTEGKIVLDRDAKTGMVDVTSKAASLDFGHEKMNKHAQSAEMFDAEKYPTVAYKGKFTKFNGNVPSEIEGDLTLHGVTKPVTLKVNQFLCKPHPLKKTEVCGADASAMIDRADFGINYGQQYGFKTQVKLLISVEALAEG